MSEQEQEFIEIGFPATIGGSRVDDQRVSGPPSRMLPALRDLATRTVKLNPRMGGKVQAKVTIEVDLVNSRKVGVIQGLSHRPGVEEGLLLSPSGRATTTSVNVKLASILAFRVLSVEVPAS